MFFVWELGYLSLWSDKSTNWTTKNVVQLLAGTGNFLIRQSVVAHLVPYSVGTWGSFFGWGVKLATRLHLMASKNEWSCAFTARTGIPSSI